MRASPRRAGAQGRSLACQPRGAETARDLLSRETASIRSGVRLDNENSSPSARWKPTSIDPATAQEVSFQASSSLCTASSGLHPVRCTPSIPPDPQTVTHAPNVSSPLAPNESNRR